MKFRLTALTLIAAVMSPLVHAQSDTGRITGTITDPSGSIVANVPVP
jgi:hypothetical protein